MLYLTMGDLANSPDSFYARRLDDSAIVFVPHRLESCISHEKESELHLTASLFRYPNNNLYSHTRCSKQINRYSVGSVASAIRY